MRARPAIAATATCEHGRARAARHAGGQRRTGRRAGAARTFAAVGLALLALAVSTATLGAARAEAATARVQYVSSSSVYLDAGRAAGLAEGATVRVERQGQPIADLLVEFVAEHSASCKIVTASTPPRAGDTVTFAPAEDRESEAAKSGGAPGAGGGASAGAAAGAADAAGTSAAGAGEGPPASAVRARDDGGTSGWRTGAMHGSVSFLYRNSGESDGTLHVPAMRADVRWSAAERRQLSLRIRGDRPVLSVEPTAASLDRSEHVRLYELELRYRGAREHLELGAGRFVPARLEPMGYVDGGSGTWQARAGLRIGVAGGGGGVLGPDGFTTEGWKLGAFLEASDSRSKGPARWRALLGAARLDDATRTRRAFVLLRSDARFGARVHGYEYAEIDFNPEWKRDLGAASVEWTTIALGTQIEVHPRVSVTLGGDGRRDPLLPQQLALPPGSLPREQTYGANGALAWRLSAWTALRVGADLRRRSDGSRATRAFDGSLTLGSPGLPEWTGFLHGTVYDATPGQGTLLDAGVRWRPHPAVGLDAAAGSQFTQGLPGVAGSTEDLRTQWFRAGADWQAPRGLWAALTGEWRGSPQGHTFYLEIGERF